MQVYISDKAKQYKEIINCALWSTFYITWGLNTLWALHVTLYNDGSIAYNLAGIEGSVFFDGQEYIVKQCATDYSNGVETKELTCTHVYNQLSQLYNTNAKTGTLTYTIQNVLDNYLKNNSLGFSYQVVGTFDKQQITDLGNNSGMDMLTQIVSTWPDAVIYPDNKNIKVFSSAEFYKSYGNRIDYERNASEVKLTTDSTTLLNSVTVSGKVKDDGSYYFSPFVVENSESIQKWGRYSGYLSDERFTTAANMKTYAESQLVAEPVTSVEVSLNTNEKPIAGEIRRLQVNQDFATNVKLVGYTWYPIHPATASTFSFNNIPTSILNTQTNLSKSLKTLTNNNLTLTRHISVLNAGLSTVTSQASSLAKQATSLASETETLANRISALENSNTMSWSSGSKFVDLSSNNGSQAQSWYSNLYSAGVRGAIIKLTQGSADGDAYVNPLFSNQKTLCGNAGIKFIGAYHYLRCTSVADAQAEAKWFLQYLQSNNIAKTAIVACDIEDSALSTDKTTLTSELTAFYKVLTDAGYTNTCDYASASWFSSRFGHVAKYSWIASWGASTAPDGADAWQYTDKFNGLSLDCSYSYNQAFI